MAEDEISDTTVSISMVNPVTPGLGEESYSAGNDSVRFNTPGTYEVELSAEDESGNVTIALVYVAVVDQTAPEFHGLKSSFVLSESDTAPDYLADVTAEDEIDGDLTERITLDAVNVSYGIVGDYTVTYSVADDSGNITMKNVPVTIKDTTPPELTLSKTSFSLTAGDKAPDYSGAVTAYDATDGELSSSIQIDDSGVDYDTPGTYEITYRVCDNSGNATTKTATVTVKEKAAPSVDNSSSGPTVYITNTGSKYHANGCRYLSKSKIAISKSAAIAQGYTPCKVCKPG